MIKDKTIIITLNKIFRSTIDFQTRMTTFATNIMQWEIGKENKKKRKRLKKRIEPEEKNLQDISSILLN